MLISPPFLPPRATFTEENWINDAMKGDATERGAFPVSLDLGWHGGLHLDAPAGATTSGNLDVLAIADGTVVYCRKPKDKNDDPADPLNYSGGWTSDGCVVLRHETDIGEGDNAKVVFYSVTMHLNALNTKIKPNAKIYRKEELGQAGYIRGNANKIHIEIICDDINLAKLIGRSNNTFNANGRTDAVYGEIYFKLPVGTSLYQNQPADNITTPVEAAAHVTTTPYIIGLRYSCGEAPPAINNGTSSNNPSAGKGGAILSTYQEDGTLIANGQIAEPDSEYNLYKRAMAINKVYNDAHATVVPAPSAIYELLRFGRIINTANETLTPADTPHWRKVKYEGGEGWVNLNQTNIPVYSDADFPPWKGWLLVDDDTDGDSRCDSNILKQWLDVNKDGKVDHAEAERIISQDGIKSKLCKTICKLPTEWAKADTATRYQWLKAPNEIRPEVMSDEDFAKMTAHIEALGFWDEANIGIDATHWHFEPREFIKHFRMCGWLNATELAQCIPRRCLSGTTNWDDALQRAMTHQLSLNQYFRKYYGNSRQRILHALAQIYIETGMLALMVEGGQGNNKPYGPLYGRGYMQLTWGGNYRDYGKYKSLPSHNGSYIDPRITTTSTHAIDSGGQTIRWFPRYDPDIVASNLHHAGDSSGFFWVTKRFRGTNNMNKVADLGFSLTTIGFASWLVNGGGNGYVNRHQFAMFLKNYLFDDALLTGNMQFSYPPLTPLVNLGTTAHPNWTPLLCSTYPPTEVPYSSTGTINYEYQRP